MAGEWREMPFSQAVTVNPRVQLTRGATYPFVDMGAVSAGTRSVFASEQRQFDGGGSRFTVGDTLMARITPCLENGKIARFAGPSGEIAHGSTEFIVICGRDGVSDTDYAYYLTKWDGVSGHAISQMTGTSGRQRVPSEALDHLEVPVPPLP
jgi:type I restriction enzyme S subunit